MEYLKYLILMVKIHLVCPIVKEFVFEVQSLSKLTEYFHILHIVSSRICFEPRVVHVIEIPTENTEITQIQTETIFNLCLAGNQMNRTRIL